MPARSPSSAFGARRGTASSLNHPAICTVYETGFDQGRHFLSMELLEGEPLSERLQRGPFELRPLIEFALHISGGLGAAHRKNIVHRDLKPGESVSDQLRSGKDSGFRAGEIDR